MTIAETIIKKVLDMPVDQQARLLDLVREFESKRASQRRDPEGLLANTPTRLTFADFKQNRRDLWGASSDRELR